METIRFARLGQEDINFGKGTFEVRLADGRVVVLNQVDLGDILSDADLSTRNITLDTLTVTTLTPGTLAPTSTLQVPEKADPGSPASGEVWINSGGTVLEYADDQAVPVKHALVGDDTTQTLTNKTLTGPTITNPTLSGTVVGTYTLSGTITLNADFNLNGGDFVGIDEIGLQNSSSNPTAAGRIRRNDVNLLFHDGTNAKLIILDTAVQTLSNKTLDLATIVSFKSGGATITTPSTTGTLATLANAETFTNKTIISGSAPATPTADVLYAESMVKGYVKFNSSGTISADYNVSSVADNATGYWQVNWDLDFANSDYTVVATAANTTPAARYTITRAQSVGATEISTYDSTPALADTTFIHVVAYGAQ